METILNKAKNYYMKAKPDYTSSPEFQNLVTGKMNDIMKKPCSIYVFMKDVIDEIKARRLKQHKPSSKASNGSVNINSNTDVAEPGPSGHTKEGVEDKAQRDTLEAVADSAESTNLGRQIKKLSKVLKVSHRMLQRIVNNFSS